MKAYLVTTAIVFALIIVAHITRLVTHEWSAAGEPGFLLSSAIAAALFVWAIVLLRRGRRKTVDRGNGIELT